MYPVWTAIVSLSAEDVKALATKVKSLPRAIIDNFNKNGITSVTCPLSVTDLCPDLAGVQPRGWPNGSTWDSVPGVYQGLTKRVVACTMPDGSGRKIPGPREGPNQHGAFDLVGHEAGHGFDVSDPGPPKNAHPDFRKAREDDKTRGKSATPWGLVGGADGGPDNYFLTTAEGGNNDAGAISETFAESCANFAGSKPGAWPALQTFWQNNPWT